MKIGDLEVKTNLQTWPLGMEFGGGDVAEEKGCDNSLWPRSSDTDLGVNWRLSVEGLLDPRL